MFKRQADEFGFSRDDYMKSLEEIPVVDEQRLRIATSFLGEMALVISQIGYAKLVSEMETEERRKIESSLRESEENYRALFEGAAEGILVADIETKVFHFINSSACKMFGYSPEELTQMSVNDIHPEEDLKSVLEAFEAQARGEMELAVEIPCQRKDDTIFYADIRTQTMVIGGCTMAIGFFSDVTERRNAEIARQKMEAQMVQAQKMEAIGRLAGGVAHDFNNLLLVIMGFAEVAVAGTREGDPNRNALNQIVEAGERAAFLTRQLLAFSRKQTLKLEPLDLNRVVYGMEEMLKRVIGEDVRLVIEFGQNLGVFPGDFGQVEQVVLNLTFNARDAMPTGGVLKIETSNVQVDEKNEAELGDLKAGIYVMLKVSDTGVGIDEKTRAQIFEPFFTTKEIGKGTGLGLSAVYGIVRQFGGAIYVDSEVGTGTSFSVYLPSVKESVRESESEQKELTNTQGTETIILVEDDSAVRNLTEQMLSACGYVVHAAANAGEALLICEELDGKIELLLTDVIMPRMHGRALADRLLKISPSLKVLFMSGYTHDVTVPHGVDDSDSHFIAKPFRAETLAMKVREVLDS